jgi:hypothetical protein
MGSQGSQLSAAQPPTGLHNTLRTPSGDPRTTGTLIPNTAHTPRNFPAASYLSSSTLRNVSNNYVPAGQAGQTPGSKPVAASDVSSATQRTEANSYTPPPPGEISYVPLRYQALQAQAAERGTLSQQAAKPEPGSTVAGLADRANGKSNTGDVGASSTSQSAGMSSIAQSRLLFEQQSKRNADANNIASSSALSKSASSSTITTSNANPRSPGGARAWPPESATSPNQANNTNTSTSISSSSSKPPHEGSTDPGTSISPAQFKPVARALEVNNTSDKVSDGNKYASALAPANDLKDKTSVARTLGMLEEKRHTSARASGSEPADSHINGASKLAGRPTTSASALERPSNSRASGSEPVDTAPVNMAGRPNGMLERSGVRGGNERDAESAGIVETRRVLNGFADKPERPMYGRTVETDLPQTQTQTQTQKESTWLKPADQKAATDNKRSQQALYTAATDTSKQSHTAYSAAPSESNNNNINTNSRQSQPMQSHASEHDAATSRSGSSTGSAHNQGNHHALQQPQQVKNGSAVSSNSSSQNNDNYVSMRVCARECMYACM